MSTTSRRGFLASSLTALAAAATARAAGPTSAPVSKEGPATNPSDLLAALKGTVEDPAFQPATLFLTWQRDPTTTMTVQWVGIVGETADTRVYYSSRAIGPWAAERPQVRPYPMTTASPSRPASPSSATTA